MTVEEMAEEYLKELANKKIPFSVSNVNESIKQAFKDGFIQGQENEIHLLENIEIKRLEKENEELKKANAEKNSEVEELKATVSKMETTTIEKMKDCGNCDNFSKKIDGTTACAWCRDYSEWKMKN